MSPAGVPTPEEKLLRLIRGKAPAPAAGGAPSIGSPGTPDTPSPARTGPARSVGNPAVSDTPSPARTGPARSSAAAKPRAPAAGRRPRTHAWRVPVWWGFALNGVLAIVVVGGLAVTGWLLATPSPVPTPPGSATVAGAGEAAEPLPGPLSGGPVASIASSAARPLFVTRVPAGAPAAGPSATSQSAQASALVQRLSLIGVVAGDPAQAIIEDTQNQKTYFVTAGQGVIEGLVVDSIQGNRVTLSLGTEKIELSL